MAHSNKLSGVNPLSYFGVEATTPPQMVIMNRVPTVNDFQNFSLGTFWVVDTTVPQQVYLLTRLYNHVATWTNIYPIGGGGAVNFQTDAGIATTVGNTINIYGGGLTNMVTTGVGQDVTVALNPDPTVTGTVTANALTLTAGALTVGSLGATAGVMQTNAVGLVSSSSGTDGQLLIGSTGFAPAWATIVSGDASIAIAVGPNTLDIRAVGVGSGSVIFHTDGADAVVDAFAAITIVGTGTNIVTAGALNTVSIDLGTDPIATGSLTAGTLITAGTGISSTAGDIVAPAGAINAGTSMDAGTTITAGTGITATTGAITATAGNVVVTAGNLTLPNTNITGTAGEIDVGGVRFLHNYGTDNTFVGANSGNYILNPGSSTQGGSNTFVGKDAGTALVGTAVNQASRNSGFGKRSMILTTEGSYNSACGYNTLSSLTTGNYNCAVGSNSGYSSITTGEYNVFLGASTGTTYALDESSNILIGYGIAGTAGEDNVLRIGDGTGAGAGQLNTAIISGIYGRPAVAPRAAVYCSDGNVLGTTASSRDVKQDIEDMGNDSNVLYNLRPRTFKFKFDNDPKPKQYGMIAEEVESVFPEMVIYDKNGKPINLSYEFLAPMLVNEIQKLQKAIYNLNKKINTLEARITKGLYHEQV